MTKELTAFWETVGVMQSLGGKELKEKNNTYNGIENSIMRKAVSGAREKVEIINGKVISKGEELISKAGDVLTDIGRAIESYDSDKRPCSDNITVHRNKTQATQVNEEKNRPEYTCLTRFDRLYYNACRQHNNEPLCRVYDSNDENKTEIYESFSISFMYSCLLHRKGSLNDKQLEEYKRCCNILEKYWHVVPNPALRVLITGNTAFERDYYTAAARPLNRKNFISRMLEVYREYDKLVNEVNRIENTSVGYREIFAQMMKPCQKLAALKHCGELTSADISEFENKAEKAVEGYNETGSYTVQNTGRSFIEMLEDSVFKSVRWHIEYHKYRSGKTNTLPTDKTVNENLAKMWEEDASGSIDTIFHNNSRGSISYYRLRREELDISEAMKAFIESVEKIRNEGSSPESGEKYTQLLWDKADKDGICCVFYEDTDRKNDFYVKGTEETELPALYYKKNGIYRLLERGMY